VRELSQGTNTKLVILSLQTSSSVRRPDVCRPGMDGNHKTAVFRAAPYIMTQHQAGAIEMVMGKVHFEQWLWDQCVFEVKHYHGDNGIFSAEEYRRDCDEKGQSQSFSGVGAQHQNARAERAIQIIMNMARTFMVHASLHWTDRGSDDLSLWSFVVKHSVSIYNHVPNAWSGLTPLELVTKEWSDYGHPPLSCVGMPGVCSRSKTPKKLEAS
jgi:hypothetical protein